jgi:fermentation-respiration switch protein FrsA (DUF1100 family)
LKKSIILLLLCAITLFGCDSAINSKELDSTQKQTEMVGDTKDVAEKTDTVETTEKEEVTAYEPITGDNLAVSEEFAKDIVEVNFEKLLQAYSYDAKMKKAMASEDTKKTVLFYNATHGDLVDIKEAYTSSYANYQYAIVPIECSNEKFNLQVAFDGNNRIVGFTYAAYAEKDSSANKKIPDNVVETEYSFNNDGYLLTGTLTQPKEGTDFPVVIFVHGSGANDRDESIFGNKPFRDIAWALAEQGIASYRYDKRSYLYAQQMQKDTTLTIYDESIDDAVAAAKMVSGLKNMNASKVYILGHSLGGYVIPRIAEQYAEAAGFIMMAAPAEHLKEYITEQYVYLANEDKIITKEERQLIDKIKNQCIELNNPNKLPKNKLILGAYRNYWIDLGRYQAVKAAKKINSPVLVLQGERDYQVTMDQFKLWKKAFQKKENWSFKSYPELNHFMMAGEGKPGPSEYEVISSVDIQVIQDIADFINK